MTTPIDVSPDLPIGELVVRAPGLAPVLDRLGLDYCRYGERTLAEACAAAGLDLATVTGELASVPDPGAPEPWTNLSAGELADHIEATHHRFLHEELPAIDALAEQVESVHRARHPELIEVRALVASLRADLEPHLAKEERVLFPAIRALAVGRRDFPFGSVANPIRQMRLEHDAAGELLVELRKVTDGYAVPDDACASYRSLYERLEAVERDLRVHIHKENNVLFPRVVELAGSG